jgi:RND superfamily putative drug exporter
MAAMPSALRLLGRAAWWFPRRLDRAIPALLAETQPALTPAVPGHMPPSPHRVTVPKEPSR